MKRRIGACFIGALGSISITSMIGAMAIKKSLADPLGMITSTEPFQRLGLTPTEDIIFSGFDVRQEKLTQAADAVVKQFPFIDHRLMDSVRAELKGVEGSVIDGVDINCGEAIGNLSSTPREGRDTLRGACEYLMDAMNRFSSIGQLDDLVVVNLASTEPPLKLEACHKDITLMEQAFDQNRRDLFRASSVYAYAAIKSGYPYINFTPSNGALFPAMVDLALEHRVPVMGDDGKTGETLVKSALAPMFRGRNLQVMSWEGFNILGNMDGKVLDHPENRESKIQTKDALLPQILGYAPHSRVHINYVPSLADQKTAWDFIHFKGFLGATMSLQFTWQGFDSVLAAPLTLDLIRLAEFAHRRGEAGLMPQLASYFKAPLGVDKHGLVDQLALLTDYAAKASREPDLSGGIN